MLCILSLDSCHAAAALLRCHHVSHKLRAKLTINFMFASGCAPEIPPGAARWWGDESTKAAADKSSTAFVALQDGLEPTTL